MVYKTNKIFKIIYNKAFVSFPQVFEKSFLKCQFHVASPHSFLQDQLLWWPMYVLQCVIFSLGSFQHLEFHYSKSSVVRLAPWYFWRAVLTDFFIFFVMIDTGSRLFFCMWSMITFLATKGFSFMFNPLVPRIN